MCATPPTQPPVVGPLLAANAAYDPARIPGRPRNVDWGLALSGGGIRSASFSIGVMKALYEQGLMDDIDVISSVSGGGYASYWLLTGYAEDRTREFGAAAFDGNYFLGNVCKLQETSDFLKVGGVLSRIFLPKPKALEYYEQRIQRSFGNPRPASRESDDKAPLDPRPIIFLNEEIKSGAVPYFIFNGSLDSKNVGSFPSLMEVTPDYLGNPVLGFVPWGREPWPLVKAVGVSGAAVKIKLKTKTDNYARQIVDEGELQLWDGGGAENLAALPLIRRGIKNIIIVDASSDGNYEFEGYRKLQRLLARMGIAFHVSDIDLFLTGKCDGSTKKDEAFAKAVSEGRATSSWVGVDGQPIDSRILFVKLARPASILHEDPERSERGRKLARERDSKIACHKLECNCSAAPALTEAQDLYFYVVNHYDEERERKKIKIWKFPQVLLLDQNPKLELMEALIGLGYLQGLELRR